MKSIRELREAKGWSQAELAHRLSVAPSTIYNWESGRYEPRINQFRALSAIFEVPMDDIELTDETKKLLAA